MSEEPEDDPLLKLLRDTLRDREMHIEAMEHVFAKRGVILDGRDYIPVPRWAYRLARRRPPLDAKVTEADE